MMSMNSKLKKLTTASMSLSRTVKGWAKELKDMQRGMPSKEAMHKGLKRNAKSSALKKALKTGSRDEDGRLRPDADRNRND